MVADSIDDVPALRPRSSLWRYLGYTVLGAAVAWGAVVAIVVIGSERAGSNPWKCSNGQLHERLLAPAGLGRGALDQHLLTIESHRHLLDGRRPLGT